MTWLPAGAWFFILATDVIVRFEWYYRWSVHNASRSVAFWYKNDGDMRLTSSSPSVDQAVQLWHPFSYTNWDVIAPDIPSSVTPFQLCLPRIRWRHAQLSWISTTYDVHHIDVPCVCTLSAILRISLPFSRKNTHLEDLEDKVLIMYQKKLGWR